MPNPFLPTSEEEDNKDLIAETAATAKEQEKPRGVISEIGDFIDQGGILTAIDSLAEQAAKATEGTIAGKVFRPIADVIPSDEQLREFTADIPVVGKPMTALETGLYQGAMTTIGLTPAARLANQQADWNQRPASLQDAGIVSDLIYEGSRILLPTLAWRQMGIGLKSQAATRLVESGVEALGQESAEDLIAGRKIAEIFGKIYGTQTTEEQGAELTRMLIEGDEAAVQPLLMVWATAQNYGVNLFGESLWKIGGVGFRAIRRHLANNAGNLDQLSDVLGMDPDEVARQLTDTKEPQYRPDAEPSDTITPDVVGNQLKPTDESGLNVPGFINSMLADAKGIGLDLNDPSNYFYDWSRVADNKQAAIELSKALFDKAVPEAGTIGRARLIKLAAEFMLEHGPLMEKDQVQFLMKMQDFGAIKFNDPRLDATSQAPQAWKELERDYVKYYGKFAESNFVSEAGLAGIYLQRGLLKQQGLKLVNMADQIMKMRETGQDPSDFIENVFIPNQKFASAVAGPFRGAQRQFYYMGEMLQDAAADDVARLLGLDPDIPPQQAARKIKKPGLTLDGEKIQINVDGEDYPVDTLTQLWSLAQDGNEQASDVFYLALANLRFGDPEKVLTNLDIVSDIVKQSLKDKQGFEKYVYNAVALGQLSTQTNSVGATVFRQSLEPLALAIDSVNPLSRHSKPKDGLYGLGMFIGGMYHMKSSLRAGLRALKTNVPTDGKGRFTESYSSGLLQEYKELQRLHRYQLQDMVRNEAHPFMIFNSWLGQKAREIAYHPIMNTPVRLLMASDESAKVTTGGQHAWGRAFVNLWDRAEFSPRQMMAQIKFEESRIFRGPAWKNNIIDAEVKAAADRQTLQESFSIDEDSNQIERFFAAQAEANKVSRIQRLFNLFPRASYRQIEQEYVETVGTSLGLGRFNRKLQAMRSNPDPTQRLAFQSQVALGQIIAGASATIYLMGRYGNGFRELIGQDLPEISYDENGSLLIQGEDFDTAITTGKFSPSTVFVSILGAAIDSFLDGSSSEQTMIDKIGAFSNAIATNIIDRNLLQGQQKFARTVDVDSPNYGSNLAGFLWEFVSPNVIREIADIIQPYETVQDVRTFPGQAEMSQAAKGAFSNIQNPMVWDIYAPTKTKYAKPKVATSDPGDPNAVRQSMIASYFWPGRITPTRFSDPVSKAMKKADYSVQRDYLRRVANVELDANQQSNLSQAIQGNLYKALEFYVNGKDYKKTVERYNNAVESFGRGSTQAKEVKDKLYYQFNQIHRNVKIDAIQQIGLDKDPRIAEALQQLQLFDEQAQGPISSKRQGLYAQAAQQDTPLARQVRDILDIA